MPESDDLRTWHQRSFDRIYDAVTKAKLSNDENYDRSILTIASAALGVSVHFALATSTQHYQWMLIAGWICLGAAAVLMLLAYKIGNKALDFTLDKAHSYHVNNQPDAINRKNEHEDRHQRCTLIGGAFLLLGMALLAAYFSFNLPHPPKENPTVSNGTEGSGKPSFVTPNSAPDGQNKVTAAASSPRIMQMPATEERAASSPQVMPAAQESPGQPAAATSSAAAPATPPPSPPPASSPSSSTPLKD